MSRGIDDSDDEDAVSERICITVYWLRSAAMVIMSVCVSSVADEAKRE